MGEACNIPELGVRRALENLSDDETGDVSVEYLKTIIAATPIETPIHPIAGSYTDHHKKCDMVMVYKAVPIISGSKDGLSVTISYVWPQAMFNALQLFESEINDMNRLTRIY